MTTGQREFEQALAHHQAGRYAEAEQGYRSVLMANPGHADSHHLLGMIAHQHGLHDVALTCISNAIAIDARPPLYHNNLGNVYAALKDEARARAAFERALELQPDLVPALNNLGMLLERQGDANGAVARFRRAIELQPDLAEAHNNLGNALAALGDQQGAELEFRRALELRGDLAEARNNLGLALLRTGRTEEAVSELALAAAADRATPETHNSYGNALAALERWADAVDAYRTALDLRPGFDAARVNLQNAIENARRVRESAAERDQDEASLHAALAAAFQRGEVAIDIEYKMVAHPHCPTGGEFWVNRAAIVLVAITVVAFILAPWQWAFVAVAVAIVAYATVGRRWVNQRMIGYARKQILGDATMFRRMWRFGGVTLTDRRPQVVQRPFVSPDDDWRRLARQLSATVAA